MEKMCLSSLICDGRESHEDKIAEKIICAKNQANVSPVIEPVTHSKKSEFFPYADDDIPSYQIFRDSKRISDVSEEQESILPISPVITPPRIEKKDNFQVPFVPTIGTIMKKNAYCKVTLPENVNIIPTKESTKKCKSPYEVLGMIENDISWDSSMETPAQKLLTLGDYNTIEKATLLPEKDLKNMQPRMLFSPNENDDSECLPLKFSSESEDEKDSCSTKLKSPAKKEINVKAETSASLKGITGIKSIVKNESPKTIVADDSFMKNSALSPISPVFRISRKKSKTRKQKSLLVKSPDIAAENSVKSSSNKNLCETNKNMVCNIDLCNKVPVTEMKETNNDHNMYINEQSEEFQDDSLQNISLSCFDESCNSSDIVSDCNFTHNTNISPAGKKQADFGRNNSTKYNVEKNPSLTHEKKRHNELFFYDGSRTDELLPVTSLDDFLKSAKEFEEFDVMVENKSYKTFNDNGLMVCSEMINDEFPGQDLKRIRPVSEKSPEACHKNIEILNKYEAFPECTRNEEGRMEVEHLKKQQNSVKSTQSGINDSQRCLTAICSERLINNGKKVNCFERSLSNINEQSNNDQLVNKYVENSDNNRAETQIMFFPASGPTLPIPLSNKSDVKALNVNVLKHDCEEDFMTELDNKENNVWNSDFQGFTTASGAPIKISENSLNKAKKLFLDSDVNSTFPENDNFPEYSGFTTASGVKLKIAEESLKKAKNLFRDLDDIGFQENQKIMTEETPKEFVGFKTASNKSVKISEESLKKAKELWQQMEDVPMNDNSVLIQDSKPKGNTMTERTPGNTVPESLQVPVESSPIKPESRFFGFSTASGKSITVSKDALKKVRKILSEEIMDPEKKEIIMEEAEPVNKACPKESTEINENEKESSFTQDHEQGNLKNSELIPSWLHAYYSSPTLTMEHEQLKSNEDCSLHSTPRERYLIRSPVLGKTDRFFNKRKKRSSKKLFFKSPNQQLLVEDENVPDNARMKTPSVKRDSSELDTDFTIPFKKKKMEEDVADVADVQVAKLSFEVINGRKKARLEQAKAGEKLKVNPVQGSHLLKKKQKQMSWHEALKGNFPERYSDKTLRNYGVTNDVLQITSTNALDFRFKAQDFFTFSSCLSNTDGFPVGDECLLIFDDDNTAGVEEITRAFFASPGVEPNLISPEWIKNHYKWIVWKFSHYERSFPHVFGGNCLTPHNVMVQLKYRYDREIDGSERSALKKILEHDGSSRKRIVLCISDIKKSSHLCNTDTESSHNSVSYVLEMTDGWYSCCVQTDPAMSRLVEEGKVITGTKLVTHGAELLVSEGVSPLENPHKIHLKIYTNSTRRVKWDTKLGFQKNGGPLLVSLNSILPNGGLVGRLDVVIMRIYPVLYLEKKSDGTHVLRNSRVEDIAASAYQKQQEEVFEKIYQQVRDEIRSKAKENEKSLKNVTMSDVSKITDAEELFRLFEGCSDPSSFQNLLTPEQNELLVDYQLRLKQINNKELSDRVEEKIKIEKISTRKVTQLLRVKVVDLHKSDYDNPVLLTIWNSTEDVSQMLSEGKALSIFNIVPNNSRFHKPIQLNSTRYTRYKELTKIVEYPARKLVSLEELTPDYEPVFNEIDTVGIVVFIRETSYGSRLSQTVYLADLEYNFVGLVFWGSCKNLGWENVLTVGSVVACSNLQWSNKRYFGGIPKVYVTDSSVFKENPKENFLKEGIKVLRSSLPEDMKTFIAKCEEEIIAKLDDQKLSNVSKNTSHPFDSSNSLTIIKPKYINGFRMKPNASSTPFKSRAFGLDTSDQEPSPIQKRIEKLLMYGEPPPLSPLLPLDNLEKVNTKFKPPFKTGVDPSSK